MTAIRDYIDGLGADGGTAIYSGARARRTQAVADAQAKDPNRLYSIVLMTDGENNAGVDTGPVHRATTTPCPIRSARCTCTRSCSVTPTRTTMQRDRRPDRRAAVRRHDARRCGRSSSRSGDTSRPWRRLAGASSTRAATSSARCSRSAASRSTSSGCSPVRSGCRSSSACTRSASCWSRPNRACRSSSTRPRMPTTIRRRPRSPGRGIRGQGRATTCYAKVVQHPGRRSCVTLETEPAGGRGRSERLPDPPDGARPICRGASRRTWRMPAAVWPSAARSPTAGRRTTSCSSSST